MKYTTAVTIDKPIEKVIELLSDVNNIQKWQPELVSYETIEGTVGKVGAKSKMTIKMGRKKMVMTETIIHVDMPNEFTATYKAPGVFQTVHNYFTKIDENTTKYSTVNEFQYTTLFMKVVGTLMAIQFKRNCDLLLQNFKNFAEKAN